MAELQIEDIKINRHHKFLVYIFNWLDEIFMSYGGKYKTINHQWMTVHSPEFPFVKIPRYRDRLS